jgi:hypothetical protein
MRPPTQGLLASLCATLILVNPVAKFAITLDPVGTAANTALTAASPGRHLSRKIKGKT